MIIEAKNGFVILTADEGKVFKNKLSGDILTKKLYLGCNDIADNYEEVNEEDVYAETDNNAMQTEDTET